MSEEIESPEPTPDNGVPFGLSEATWNMMVDEPGFLEDFFKNLAKPNA